MEVKTSESGQEEAGDFYKTWDQSGALKYANGSFKKQTGL